MTRILIYESADEAREIVELLGLDPARYVFYERTPGRWTWWAKSKISRVHRLWSTRRRAKKALQRHPGWTAAEKKLLRIVQFESGSWGWVR